jgi:ubiquinone/menaquinone biosynthesis C-methylase UbiE
MNHPVTDGEAKRSTSVETVSALIPPSAVRPHSKGVREWRRQRLMRARTRLCQHASGDVLEIGIGSGEGLEHYASEVRLTGIDVDPQAVEAARLEAQRLGRTIVVVEGDAHVLPFPAETFDGVVCFRALCEVANEAIVIEEALRVLRRGGSLLLVDHVASSWWPVRIVQQAMDRMVAPSTGEFRARRPILHIRRLGAEIVESQRSWAGLTEYVWARKPQTAPDLPDPGHSSTERMRLKSEAAEAADWF